MGIIAWQCYWCGALNGISNNECGKCKKDKKTDKQF